jgi:hypothetical protein
MNEIFISYGFGSAQRRKGTATKKSGLKIEIPGLCPTLFPTVADLRADRFRLLNFSSTS